VWENQTAHVFYYFGPQFKQLHIEVNKEQAYLIKKIPRLNEKFLRKTPFKPHEIAELLESITIYLQKNGYFGSLGEVSLSKFEDGIVISFPISPIVSLYNWYGEKVKDIRMASKAFPNQMEGLSRYNDDLQEERNFLIARPWFLKTFYHAQKKSLVRFEKKEQDLKWPDNSLNSTLFGEWYVHVSKNETSFNCIDQYEISGPEHFLPISFPFKDGILIKKLNDENENLLEFSYLEIQ
jgi:hypothetical protein